ncbi:MAG: type IV pilus assembly protein PilM [Thermodesulfobacteriota bacterium]
MAISRKNQLVGLDIGSHAIKLVEIEHTKRGRILKNFGMIRVPTDAIVEGSIKDKEAVTTAIKRLFKNLDIRNRNVAVSLSGYSVFSKKITLAVMDESGIESTIQEEAEKNIPFDVNDVNVDFAVVPSESGFGGKAGKESAEQPGNNMDVMLVAAKTSIIDEYVHLFQTAGMNPCVLDVDIFALQNALELSMDDPTKGHVIVNVGARELSINAVYGGVSTFSRDSSYGGAQITEAIMSELNVDFEQAERIKLGTGDVSNRDKDKETIREIVTSIVSSWVREVKQALDFVATTYPDETMDELLVGGGACRIPGFQKVLEIETGLPVTQINPFRSLKINQKSFDPDYLGYMAPQAGVAVGLGLRSIRDK